MVPDDGGKKKKKEKKKKWKKVEKTKKKKKKISRLISLFRDYFQALFYCYRHYPNRKQMPG